LAHRPIWKPKYDFLLSERSGYEYFEPSSIVVIEGLFALHENISHRLEIRIFIEADPLIRLKRRISRDIAERRLSEENIRKRWQTVQKMHSKHVEPQKECADIIIENSLISVP